MTRKKSCRASAWSCRVWARLVILCLGLRARGLEDAVKDVVARGIPLLGICVGMQAFFEIGEEMGEHKGWVCWRARWRGLQSRCQ